MAYIFLLLILIGLSLLWFVLKMPPKKGAAILVNSGPIILIAVGGLLTLFKRGILGVPMILFGISWLRRSRSMRMPGFSGGRKSTVRSIYLEMELDHDTGEMDGQVLTGRMTGAKLSAMDEAEILSLYREIYDDADSVALLEAYLDRYHPDWRDNTHADSSSNSGAASSFDSMSREEAYQILGLQPGASEEEIHQAWRRLVKAVHPDSGGSAFLTAKINAARDLLLS